MIALCLAAEAAFDLKHSHDVFLGCNLAQAGQTLTSVSKTIGKAKTMAVRAHC